jgi:hypothetical protein
MRLVAALLLATAAACSSPASPTAPAVPLANTFESAEALAREVLTALAERDRARLEALPLSEAEFRAHVWPELPASRPERNVPFEYAWLQLKQRSGNSMDSLLGRYGGRVLKLSTVAFKGETTQYATFSVMRESEVVAADETGREWILQLFGSAMVKNGRYKLFSYVVDE